YHPNGMSMDYWRPKTVGKNFEFSRTLSALEPYRSRVTVLSGVNNYGAIGPGGGAHTRACAGFMTGVLATPTEGSELRLALSADTSILDNVRRELSNLDRKVGASDRATVQEYAQAVRDIERQIQKTEKDNAISEMHIDRPLGIPETFDERVKVMMQLLYLAF